MGQCCEHNYEEILSFPNFVAMADGSVSDLFIYA